MPQLCALSLLLPCLQEFGAQIFADPVPVEREDRRNTQEKTRRLSTMAFLSRAIFPRTRRAHEALGKYLFEDPPMIGREAVETTSGTVLGFRARHRRRRGGGGGGEEEEEGGGDGDVFAFRGVPFATAERGAPPRPPDPWNGERDCARFGPACPQPPFGFSRMIGEGTLPAAVEAVFPPLPPDRSYSYGTFDEGGCLNANVFTPSLERGGAGGKKVLVWIHGGMFQAGSNCESGMYDAARLALDADAVVVTVNYRLNAFGFLHFPEEGKTNLGVRDQIRALEWVRDNAAAFGGDPGNVTIAGESAGGMSVGTLLGSPLARGLFHRAVCMSGAASNTYSPHLYSRARDVIERCFAGELNGAPLTADSFASIPAEMIQSRLGKLGFDPPMEKHLGTWQMLWQPFQDDDVVPLGGPLEGIRRLGTADGVPILTGYMRDEMRLWTALFYTVMTTVRTRSDATKSVIPYLRMFVGTTLMDEGEGSDEKWMTVAHDLYGIVEKRREGAGLPTDAKSVFEAMSSLLIFDYASYALARDATANTDSEAYGYTIELEDQPYQAAHARDIPLLFRGGAPDVLHTNDPTFSGDWLGDEDDCFHQVSDCFVQAISNFAETGRPSIPVGAGASSEVDWKTYPDSMIIRSKTAGGCALLPAARPDLAFLEELLRDMQAA